MKSTIRKNTLLIAVLLISGWLGAQTSSHELIVPLSKPGESGTLDVSIMHGSIKVTGTSTKDVIINITSDDKKVDEKTKDGLKKIQNHSFGLTAEERDNNVGVSTEMTFKKLSLEIKVPQNFNLKLNDISDGDIVVENVDGEIEVNHVNGGISLTNISGSALASTTNGSIKANFNKITDNTPMSFTTFNGDVDVTFPAGLKASAKIKSDMGEIYTDFDMSMKKSSPKEEKNSDKGVYRVSLEDWVYGDINGGGPEMTFKNFQGDIIIRSK